MTEMDQMVHGPGKYPGDIGGASMQGLGQHTGLMGGVLIVAGAVVSVAMALTNVRRLGLWMIPTTLYIIGTILAAKPFRES